MNIAIFLAHPSQYYIFKETCKHLSTIHKIIVIYYEKDVLNNLIEDEGFGDEVIKLNISNRGKNIHQLLLHFLKKEYSLYKSIKKNNIDLIIGTSISIAHIGKINNIPSIIITEDDVDVISISAKIGYPFATTILSPVVCNLGKWEKKGIKYNGYQKLVYLHPQAFTPSIEIAKKYVNPYEKFYLLRFASLTAHHDIGIKGISNHIAKQIIKRLQQKGKVFISSEREITSDLEPNRLKLNAQDMHHVLYFSDLLISDSQSMSVEAAMLGIPSIRFSDFAGRISVLEELEKKYELTYGIKTTYPEKLLDKIDELLKLKNLKEIFEARRQKMLKDKIDVTKFLVCFIENYPNSVKEFKSNPALQYQFR